MKVLLRTVAICGRTTWFRQNESVWAVLEMWRERRSRRPRHMKKPAGVPLEHQRWQQIDNSVTATCMNCACVSRTGAVGEPAFPDAFVIHCRRPSAFALLMHHCTIASQSDDPTTPHFASLCCLGPGRVCAARPESSRSPPRTTALLPSAVLCKQYGDCYSALICISE